MVIYSLAAPRRTTADGTVAQSCLKTVGAPFSEKTWNVDNGTISEVTIEPATAEEVEGTVKVMGGEDWIDWMDALSAADVLADNVTTLAYSYIGPELTYPIYNQGTIGKAKDCFIMALPMKLQHHYEVQDNDGLVSEESAQFGCYRGKCLDIPVSHIQIIDLFSKKEQKEQIYSFYKQVCKELSEMGF